MWEADGTILREIFHAGRASYEQLQTSGLCERLLSRGLLVPHVEVDSSPRNHPATWRVIRPERVPFISYSFEWCFGQLRDAALTTLDIQEEALRSGMTLKDASPDNIQFINARPVLIDTLSFEAARSVWAPYYQFCRRFLAPLLLTAYRDASFLRLSAVDPDGVPLRLASTLLPRRTWLRPSTALHIHFHAWADSRTGVAAAPALSAASPQALQRQHAVVDSLRRAIDDLRWRVPDTEWTRYEDEKPTYSSTAWSAREKILQASLERVRPGVVWDLGAALGHASRLAAAHGALTIAFDADPACVELMWQRTRHDRAGRLLPLVQDVLRPTPRCGWAEEESLALSDRGPADLLLVLGLLHHVTIRGGVPIDMVFDYLARLGRAALVEFIPPSDPIVAAWCEKFGRRPLTEDQFLAAARQHYAVIEACPVADSERVVFLLQRQ